VSIRRVEFDQDGNPHLAISFWPEDLGDLATVSTQCLIWLQENTEAFAAKGSAATKRSGSESLCPHRLPPNRLSQVPSGRSSKSS
jgi:hypothetical protein